MILIIDRFLLSRLESLSAAPTSLSFLRFRSKSSKSSEDGQRRDCVCRVCLPPLVTSAIIRPARPAPSQSVCRPPQLPPETSPASHRLAIARISVGMFYCLVTVSACGGKTLISRPNLLPPPPAAPYGLAPCGICGQFPHLPCRRENRPQTPQAKND